MKIIGQQWKASSIPECVVASVILMVVFLASLEILTGLAVQQTRRQSVLSLHMALVEGFRKFGDGKHAEGTYTFHSGKVEVEAELCGYGPYIQFLVLSASQGGDCVKRYHLIEKEHED